MAEIKTDLTTWPKYYPIGNYGAFCGAISYRYNLDGIASVPARIYWLGEGLCTTESDAASSYELSTQATIRGELLVDGNVKQDITATKTGTRRGDAVYTSYVWFEAGTNSSNVTINRTTATQKLKFRVTYTVGSNTYTKTSSEITINPLPKYTITFKDGSSTYTTKTCYHGKTISSWPTAPTKAGYTFKGWFTTSTGTTEKTSSSTFTSDTTLYAQWTVKTYTVTLDKNNGTGGTSSVTATYGSAMPTATMPTRTGYTFAGYYDATSGGTQYYTSAGASARTWNKTSATTLYAHWTPNIYTITLNKNGGSNGTSTIYVKYNTGWYSNSAASTSITSITIPTQSNSTFTGYYTAKSDGTQIISSSGNIISGHLTRFTENTTLYAHWTLNNKTITYNKNGGTGTVPSSVTVAASESVTIATNNLTKTSYNPNGWNTKNDGSGTHYSNDAIYKGTTDLTLYAEWIGVSYTISYNPNGGTGGPSAGTKIYETSYIIPQTIPTRSDYTFIGWMEGSDDSNNIYQPGDTYTKNNSITFYAKWESNDFTLNFNTSYLQDYNVEKKLLGIGIKALDEPPNANFRFTPQGIYVGGGIYARSKILNNIGAGVLSGELVAPTIERALYKAARSSGIMGSIYTQSSYTLNSITIPNAWYNMLYIPHRTGGISGYVESGNTSWGSMLLFGMTAQNKIYRIKYGGGSTGGAIDSIEQFYTTLNKPTGSDLAISSSDSTTIANWIAAPTVTKTSGQAAYDTTSGSVSAFFGVGSGGTNHGVYSRGLQKWICCSDGSNIYLGGTQSGDNIYNGSIYIGGSSANTYIKGDLTLGNHSSPIGTIIDSQASSSTTVPSSTSTSICSITLPAGTWVIRAFIRIPNMGTNRSKNIEFNISSTEGASGYYWRMPCENMITETILTQILTTSTGGTYHINAIHDSGEDRTFVTGSTTTQHIRAVRIA